MHIPGQPSSSLRFLRVSVGRRRGDILLEPIQLGYKILDLFLDIFEMLRAIVSAVRRPVTQPIPRNV